MAERSKGPRQIVIGSLRVNLKDLADSASKQNDISKLEQDALKRQLDDARGKHDLLGAIKAALPKR